MANANRDIIDFLVLTVFMAYVGNFTRALTIGYTRAVTSSGSTSIARAKPATYAS